MFVQAISGPESTESRLSEIWREVLDLEEALDPQADFFLLGGDSLRSLQLSVRIKETFGREVSPQDFFASPTFATLLRLLEDEAPTRSEPAVAVPDPVAWPLPAELRAQQLSILESWPGIRPTRDRLVAGLNIGGSKTPLFWVFNRASGFKQLADRLGPDQPVYALRSGSEIALRTEDVFQALALRYVHEIHETYPDGSLFLGGSCQCAAIALAIAQHLIRRGRHIPLLVLAEWGTALQPYTGRVLLAHGRDSHLNPHRRYRDPEAMWRAAYVDYESVEIAGGHLEMFDGDNLGPLGDVLEEQFERALSLPPRLLTRSACRAAFRSDALPDTMKAGETRNVDVLVRNAGRFTWQERFGLTLRSVWTWNSGKRLKEAGDRASIPALEPGEQATITLSVTAPVVEFERKRLRLAIDLSDEAGTWTDTFRKEALVADVMVTGGKAISKTLD